VRSEFPVSLVYALAKELEPGKFRPTLTHAFIRLLSEKGLLHTCFTQNIDTLERRAGIPASKIVEAHGSFATHACIVCKQGFSDEKMRDAIITQIIPRCGRSGCGGLVKPNIVFFGEGVSICSYSE
jgi:NAD-dependent histone deacetylase SIR2